MTQDAMAPLLIGETDIKALLKVTERNDELGLYDLARQYGRNPEQWNIGGGYDMPIHRIITGKDIDQEKLRHVFTLELAQVDDPIIDRPGAELLLQMGIYPAAVCAMAFLINSPLSIIRYIDWQSRMVATIDANKDREHPFCLAAMQLTQQVSYNSVRGVRIDDLPESLIMAAPGRPLRDLISHPILDKYTLYIEDASVRWNHQWFGVKNSKPDVGIDEILGMKP